MLKKIGLALIALVLAGVTILLVWYRIDGQPRPETAKFMRDDRFTLSREAGGGFLLSPAESNGQGVLIMHGALIMPQSYAKTAAFFAARGYTAYVPRGAARLSINAVDTAAKRINQLGLDDWYVIGHSMGGFSSLTLIERYQPNVKAVALWASSQPRDFTALEVPILFLWGDDDGLLPEGRFADGKANLPGHVVYETVSGANHRDFAMYTHQFFDHEGQLGWKLQTDIANTKTAEFFEQYQ